MHGRPTATPALGSNHPRIAHHGLRRRFDQRTSGLSASDVDGWDSLTHIRLMVTVEKVFKVKFSTPEMELENVAIL